MISHQRDISEVGLVTRLIHHSSDILIDDAYFEAAELCRLELNFPKKAMKYYEKIIFEFQDSIHFVDSTKHFRDLRNDR